MPSATPKPDPDPRLAYTCGATPPFAPALLGVTGAAESSSDPSAEALRQLLADEAAGAPGGESLFPAHGWWLVARTGSSASFLAESELSELGFVFASLTLANGGWHASQWGECAPQAALPGDLGPATWRIDGELPTPGSMEIDALVTELACAGGRSSEGRILEPDISYQPDAIVITFAVRPLPGAQTCPGNPAVRYRITLSEAVAGRLLFDGGELPPRDASTCSRIEPDC